LEVSVEGSVWSFYQQKMDEFYGDLLDVWRSGPFQICSGVSMEEPYVLHPDMELVLFEEVLHVDPNDPEPLHELLRRLTEKGWEIIINFMARDCILGNVAVKIGDKWFAFGQARKNEDGEPYVAEIWPLKYVLPRLSKMEIKPKIAINIKKLNE